MSRPTAELVLFGVFSLVAVVSGWRVFRTQSMVRAAFLLLASFTGTAGILLLLGSEFLGLILVLMMAGEMTIMAVFMVMFMMNPAGLNPMVMVHQHRFAIGAGLAAFAGLAAVGMFGDFPTVPASNAGSATADLGFELLGGSMLVFQTAGVALLATMIGAIALASRRGRYGDAEAGSSEPDLPSPPAREADAAAHEGQP